MSATARSFSGSLVVTVVGLALAAAVGFWLHGTAAGSFATMCVAALLAVLEISLSFDNAVVNASVMQDMTPVWRRRFLTWGMAVAVFGMRLLFPLAVVSVVAAIGPLEALRLAAFAPAEYARVLTSAGVPLGAFGAAFLAMVSLDYFVDPEKEVHWLGGLERRVARLGRFEALALGFVLAALYAFSRLLPAADALRFLVAGILGVVAFIAVAAVGAALEPDAGRHGEVRRAALGSFVYLNVLDASFSFDGVIGAFALTNNLFVIAIGLGIGAMFVRSLTILLVERGTLAAYRYLEHGAFYAVGALALVMMIGTVHEVPQLVTGLVGAGFIGVSLWASVRHGRAAAGAAPVP